MTIIYRQFVLPSICIFFLIGNLYAQSFYNFDSFIADSAFVINNKIKSVTIRIPTLLDDTTNKDFLPYQKLCFNPFGKLSTYEYDFSEKKRSNEDYIEHYYNESSKQCYKSHRFRRPLGGAGTGKDSIREEINYNMTKQASCFLKNTTKFL